MMAFLALLCFEFGLQPRKTDPHRIPATGTSQSRFRDNLPTPL